MQIEVAAVKLVELPEPKEKIPYWKIPTMRILVRLYYCKLYASIVTDLH